ncbi:hypothetical protein E2C01_066349 [Portunus trituberculatus]|uniref:Uncharacterized protein n=1 Tax=Portunus trituberculatus TaxID=210409 RepID=A0A5B7HQ17_PORTR|nr:hypothetical protein [Portunus trituberculatus]
MLTRSPACAPSPGLFPEEPKSGVRDRLDGLCIRPEQWPGAAVPLQEAEVERIKSFFSPQQSVKYSKTSSSGDSRFMLQLPSPPQPSLSSFPRLNHSARDGSGSRSRRVIPPMQMRQRPRPPFFFPLRFVLSISPPPLPRHYP